MNVGAGAKALRGRRVLWLACTSALIAAGVPVAVRAQIAPSEITPRSLRPEPPKPSAPIIDLEAGPPAQAPPGADKLHVTVARVQVSGGYPEFDARAQALFAPLQGRSVSIADLYKAAADLEKAYADQGYFLVRVGGAAAGCRGRRPVSR